jgi:hypothetical protein
VKETDIQRARENERKNESKRVSESDTERVRHRETDR